MRHLRTRVSRRRRNHRRKPFLPLVPHALARCATHLPCGPHPARRKRRARGRVRATQDPRSSCPLHPPRPRMPVRNRARHARNSHPRVPLCARHVSAMWRACTCVPTGCTHGRALSAPQSNLHLLQRRSVRRRARGARPRRVPHAARRVPALARSRQRVQSAAHVASRPRRASARRVPLFRGLVPVRARRVHFQGHAPRARGALAVTRRRAPRLG